MRTRTLVLAGVLFLCAVTTVYAVSFTSSFENTFDGWTARSLDAPIPWTVALSQDRAFDGTWSVKTDVLNLNDAAKVWIEKPFTLTPGKTYKVAVTYKFASQDSFFGAWSIIAYAGDNPAQTLADFTNLGSTNNGFEDGQYHWLTKTFNKTVTTTDGSIWVGVGVWGTFEVQHVYYTDAVTVTFTETKPPRH